MRLPHGGTVGFNDVTSRLGGEALPYLSVWMKILCETRQLLMFPVFALHSERFVFDRGSGRVFFVHIEL